MLSERRPSIDEPPRGGGDPGVARLRPFGWRHDIEARAIELDLRNTTM